MFCTECGQQNADGAKFCRKCGQPIVIPSASCTTDRANESNTRQSSRGKPTKVSVNAFTKGGRIEEAERLKAKYAKKGWVFIRFEEGGMGKTFAHFVVPSNTKKSTLWWLIGTVIGMFFWIGIGGVTPVLMMVLNGALAIGAVTLICSAKHREKVFNTASKDLAVALLVGITCFAVFAFATAWASKSAKMEQERAAAEQAQREAEQRQQLYERTLASVGALSSLVSTEPVVVYQEASKALQLFSEQFRNEAQFQQLKTDSLALMDKTKKPFAAYRFGQAKQFAAKKQFVEAKIAAENALQLDPDLPDAKQLLSQVSKQAAKQAAERAVAPVLAQAKEDMSIAKKYAFSKEYIAADTLLAGVLKKLNAIPEQHLKYVDIRSTRRTVERQKKSIAGHVKKQKAIEERARKEAVMLAALCGKKPLQSEWDGEIPAATEYMKRTAHDPDSIEVKNCTIPQLTKKFCWVTTCEVRGRNVFGGKVLNHVRFAIGKHPSIEGFGQVITATNL